MTQTVIVRDSLVETTKTEVVERREAEWRNWISREEGAKFPPESGRYHLFVSAACPWAHRTMMARSLKGLQDTVSLTILHPIWQKTKPESDQHSGWHFGNPESTDTWTNTEGLGGPFPQAYADNDPDPFFGHKTIRDYYEHAGDTEGKYSVPVLWDTKMNTIVSNESAEIMRMLNSEFDDFAKNPGLDLYPKDMRDEIDAVNAWVDRDFSNGVYRCGFARSQEAYDQAISDLTKAFDRVDSILQKQRFIVGDRFTETDLRLFVTLLRFDEIYAVYFKMNTRSVASTPSILNYCREIYQMPEIKETVYMEQIKKFYFCSHPSGNRFSIVPKGPDTIKQLEEPHNRSKM